MQSGSEPSDQRSASRHGRQAFLLAAVLATGSMATMPADLYVVCNPNVSLRAADVRDVYIGEKSFAGTARLVPADNVAAQATFLEKVIKVSADRYTSLWTKKSFRDGANPPPIKVNDAEAIAYVKQTPGACSYVLSVPPTGVSVIGKF
jgi:hypothetical protein